jgi:hypothetical protein
MASNAVAEFLCKIHLRLCTALLAIYFGTTAVASISTLALSSTNAPT